jgi:23S rRNA pseudouridine1911/1915/1917 synthase
VTAYELPEALAGERLDRALALVADLSRATAATLVADGAVVVNGRPVTVRAHRVAAGDRVEVTLPEAGADRPEPDPTIAVDVRYEDADVIVVDKPAGLVVHPGAGNPRGTLVNGLLARYPELAGVGDPTRPGIVHRLDAGTSGLLVVARTQVAYGSLVDQLAQRSVTRHYDVLVSGRVDADEGVVDAPIGRSPREPTRMAVRADGRPARTRYRVVSRWSAPAARSRLECALETGRTHQIRVHLAAIGHAVVGDLRYGGPRGPAGFDRPYLHATRLAFGHPSTGEEVELESSLPDDLRAVVEVLGAPDPA